MTIIESITLMPVLSIVIVTAVGIACFFALIALLKWLWNTTMPDVFGLKTMTFWQTLRLVLIVSILFGFAFNRGIFNYSHSYEGKDKSKHEVAVALPG